MKTTNLSSAEIMRQSEHYIAKTVNRQPVVWDRGEGCWLWDGEGKKYLDFFSGHAVMNLGFKHPVQMQAMQQQLERLVHTGNLFYLSSQVALAERLVEKTFGDKVFFSNSGAEIVELAIKMARKWVRRNQPEANRYEIITMKNSFHGRTFGALSATAQDKYRKGITPLLPGFKHVPLNDLTAAASAITDQTCAIMLEPVQGEGGIHLADKMTLRHLKELCQRNDLLLIFDEIQCGLGRTGYLNAYDYYQVTPDILLLAKPLGGGIPISALVTRNEIAAVFQVGDHGSTFGGNPVAAAAGCVLMDELSRPGFLEQVRSHGQYLGEQLANLASTYSQWITGCRGIGMIWGLELKSQAPKIVLQALERGLVINYTAENVLRFLPALIIGKPEIDLAIKTLRQIFAELDPSNMHGEA